MWLRRAGQLDYDARQIEYGNVLHSDGQTDIEQVCEVEKPFILL
jgi:hypothetical protein